MLLEASFVLSLSEMHVCSVMSDSVTPCTLAHQAPRPSDYPRQEHWSGSPFPSPGDLPELGIEPGVPAPPALACGIFTTEPPWKPLSLSDLIGKTNTQSPEQ